MHVDAAICLLVTCHVHAWRRPWFGGVDRTGDDEARAVFNHSRTPDFGGGVSPYATIHARADPRGKVILLVG